jgi:hypothetical protein
MPMTPTITAETDFLRVHHFRGRATSAVVAGTLESFEKSKFTSDVRLTPKFSCERFFQNLTQSND